MGDTVISKVSTFTCSVRHRRHILNQLNRGEGRGRISRKVFHGQRGELRQRYREGQEDQLGALGLVVNALILWTTRYMDAALNHLRATGAEVMAALNHERAYRALALSG
jgi:TnpA family transposase